jgi:hypothetical protein
MRRRFAICAGLLFLVAGAAQAQLVYSSGQNVVPAFEGWERAPDGGFNMLFGY